jgi:Domain of unknown function (DUF1707)
MSASGDEQRVSDGDRDAAAAALGAHWEAGRLGLGELEQRVDAVYAATTRAELDGQLRDLPGGRAAAPAARPRERRRFFLPGRFDFRENIELRAAPERAYDEALASIAPALGRAGYHLVASERPSMLRFVHKSGTLVRGEHPLTMLFLPAGRGGTRIVAFGEAPRAVRKAFAELRD